MSSTAPAGTAASLGARFDRIAARRPEAPAIRDAGRTVAYGELREWSDRIAAAIAARGPESAGRVALLLDAGADAVAAVFGVWKAGHATVVLDPGDPPERLRGVLEDAEPFLVVARPGWSGIETPALALADLPSAEPGPLPEVTGDTTAVLVYTSGSTGAPKGVIQTHRNLLHFAETYARALDIRDEDRVSAVLSFSFAASNLDILGALLHGATLCPSDLRRRGVAHLGDWIDEEGVSVLHLGPTLFRHLLRSDPERRFPSVRAVDLAGEALFPGDVALARGRFGPGCRLVHHLAATEASVIAQARVEDLADRVGPLPAGRPASGIHAGIRDESGNEVPPGTPGEIVVHSPYLSPGYWRRPDLTRNAFSDDPDRPGWRTYRTGDLGRLDPEGTMYFLGRRASRLKIRGHSIDAAEVEAALRGVPGVRDAAAVAVAPEEGEGDLLVAYVVVEGETNVRGVRAALKERLLPALPVCAFQSCMVGFRPKAILA